ncbi:MAG: NADPH:quinone reductase-like Zn-dependent oxidoreductase [Rhodothermales bacterium]|jgi:NADPH:quinone reductase-like Zn-dependent oxidoreductase
MQAVTHQRYGSFDGLAFRTLDKPIAKENEVLIKVHAAGLHVGDVFAVRGAPFVMRFSTGLFKPKPGIPGFDVAGVVEAVGKTVIHFLPGDRVFGAGFGTCAEYVCVAEKTLSTIPEGVTFEDAAATPTSGLAALHALRDVIRLQPGQSILVNGASGGVGSFAVQIAHSMGAVVTGVCSTKNVDAVRGLGADHVIDYTQTDFADGSQQYDAIFDNIENRPLAEVRRALSPTGTLVVNSGTGASGLAMMTRLLKPLLISPFVRQNLRRYLSVANGPDLAVLGEMISTSALKPVIGKSYPVKETAAALSHIATGRAVGKVVVTM